MERHHRPDASPGREHRSESSRRPYSDEQETYRNPRNEYRDEQNDGRRSRGGDFELSRHGSRDYRDRDFESDEANRYGASERGYGYGDAAYRSDYEDRYEPGYAARRQGQPRDTWDQPAGGDFSDSRTRWPRDDRYRSEPRSQNWPHSRSGGGGMEYGGRPIGEDYTGRGPRNYSRSDERIKEDICDELSADPECNAEDLEIEVKDGEVTLTGSVPSRRMKHRAEDIADGARGVKEVENRIRVTRAAAQRSRHSGREENERKQSASPNGASKSGGDNMGNNRSSRSARGRSK